jgi:glycerol-3-phosphate dehydrogenase
MSLRYKGRCQVYTSLNAARREGDLAALAAGEVVDVLVVGLGVTGAGAALDAASRGLRVAAIDAHDLAFGTSRWSSKLIHGGLRYLAKLQVGVAYESAAERHVLMTRTAPHLVRPLPIVMPVASSVSRSSTAFAASAVAAGELLRIAARTPRRVLPRPRRLSAVETHTLAPALRFAGLHGGLLSWEGQLCDDARLVVGLARAAAGYGARVVTRCRALSLGGDEALVRDELTGSTFPIQARAVVNATGVWAGTLASAVVLRPSRGTHIVLRAESFGGLGVGVMVPVPGELNRYVFALPQWDGRVYAGLTDEPIDGPVPDVPQAPEADIAFLLDVLNSALERPLEPADVLGAYAGLRPLLAGGTARTADMSRRHAVIAGPDGVVTVVGGKLTTYRRMAADAVDAVVRARHLPAGPSHTRRIPLPGAAPADRLATLAAPRRLVARYGTEAPRILAEAGGEPHLLAPVFPGSPVTGAELRWAVRHEGALDVDDLLDRRTRIGLVTGDREAALPVAQQILAEEVAAYRSRSAAT